MFHSSCRRQISLYDIRNPVVWQEKVFPPPGRVEEKPGDGTEEKPPVEEKPETDPDSGADEKRL